MSKLVLFVLVGMAGMCLAAVRVEKERWHAAPRGWKQGERAPAHRSVRLSVFVKQTNTDVLHDTLMRVSDPTHRDYGKHLSFEQVNRLTAPSEESIAIVLDWLSEHGVDESAVNATPNGDILQVEVPVSVAERLLGAQYFTFHHQSGVSVLRIAHSYSLPAHVAPHVDFVGPTIRFPRLSGLRARPVNAANDGVTPDFLRSLYSVGSFTSTHPRNRQGVASFLGQFYTPSDLQSFFSQFDAQAVGRTPKVVGPNDATNPGIEAMLDIEYIMALGNNVSSQFWSTPGTQPRNPENEPFLDWLYNVGNASDAPWVFSISYGDNEDTVWLDYAERVNVEFQKAGVRGISLMASSGDGGVSGSQPSECTQFIPTYPAASPYVIAVGGSTSSGPETASTLSGGGFSNRWPRMKWQTAAVTQYFKVAQNLPDPSLYNHTGAGFPDVAAQAEDFNIVVDGFAQAVDGTSCSSPTFTGIVALLNELRLQKGKPTLGFLAPLFYQNAAAFNDITTGNNPGCGTNGFQAAVGWDPVTGLGSPNFAKLRAVVEKLP